MKTILAATAAAILLLIAAGAAAETVGGLPLHVQKLGSGAIRIWLGDHVSTTAVVAIPTAEGVVVVDTAGDPEIDGQLRRIIARELGRDDFVLLIDTHEHGDHTGGNAAYADCEIVGHELVAAGMERAAADRPRVAEWLGTRVADLEAEIARLAADAPELPALREQLTVARRELAAARGPAEIVPPTRTFADRLVLDLGGTPFELYYIGGMHSASDIAVLVPTHGLLLTGDTMADVWLTDTPGCLAAFIARSGVRHDFPLLLENWNLLLARRDDVRTLLPGHWNGELTMAGFEARVRYVEALWAAATRAAADGTTLDQLLAGQRLADRFPELVDSPGCSQGNNHTTIVEMWSAATGQLSAAQALYDLIDRGADETAVRAVLAQHDAETPTHFFLESQINGYGYRFLQQDMVEQATAMFRINVELFPQSWNVYDSLGEALLQGGDRDGAAAMYGRSLELNPENDNGRQALERIRDGEL